MAQSSPRIEQLAPELAKILSQSEPIEHLAEGFGGAQGPAEGPLWWHEGGYLLFSDIHNDRRMKHEPGKGGASLMLEPTNRANGLTRDLQGRLIACEHDSRRVTRQELDGSITVVANSFQGRRLNRPNDVVVKSDGSIYFTDPWTSPAAPEQWDLTFSGVYRVTPDLGTLTLLKEAPAPPAEGNILDLGAGYGPIAIALARASPDARIWAVDVNQRALELSRANAEAAGVANVTVAAPDDVPDGVRFAAIYSNPPVRIGKAALHRILERWLDRLAPGGAAYLVVQRNLGSDSLAAWLAASGRDVDRLKAKKGYRILRVRAA